MSPTQNSNKWHVFTVSAISARKNPAVSPISETSFVVMGGYNGDGLLPDVIVDIRSETGSLVDLDSGKGMLARIFSNHTPHLVF